MGKTANQIYNLSGASDQGIKFSEWISGEKALYESKVEKGAISRMPFLDWLNKRWQGKMNYNLVGTSIPVVDNATIEKAVAAQKKKSGFGAVLLESAKDVASSALQKTIEKAKGGSGAAPSGPTGGYVEPERRIFGLKPVVAYTLGAAATIGLIAGTIYLVKKHKQNA